VQPLIVSAEESPPPGTRTPFSSILKSAVIAHVLPLQSVTEPPLGVICCGAVGVAATGVVPGMAGLPADGPDGDATVADSVPAAKPPEKVPPSLPTPPGPLGL
jgi:hypothetical protein